MDRFNRGSVYAGGFTRLGSVILHQQQGGTQHSNCRQEAGEAHPFGEFHLMTCTPKIPHSEHLLSSLGSSVGTALPQVPISRSWACSAIRAKAVGYLSSLNNRGGLKALVVYTLVLPSAASPWSAESGGSPWDRRAAGTPLLQLLQGFPLRVYGLYEALSTRVED